MRRVVGAMLLAGWCTGCEAILGFGETPPPDELGDANSGAKDVGNLTGPEDTGSHETRSSDTEDTSSSDVGIDVSLDPDVRSDAAIGFDARDAAAENISVGDSSVTDVLHENDVASDGDGAAEEVSDVATDDADPSDPTPEDLLSDIPATDMATPEADVTNDASEDADASRGVTDGPSEEGPEDAGWSPQDLSYLTLWLDGARGIEGDGGAINSWLDQSPHHHRAVPGNPLLLPTWVSHGIGLYPGVAFAGTGDVLQVADSPSLQYGTRDYLIEVVLRHSTPLNSTHCDNLYGAIYLKQIRDVGPFRGAVLFANTPETPTPDAIFHAGIDGLNFTQSPVGTAYNDDVPRLVGMYRHGNVLSLRVNGFQVSAVTTPTEGGAPLNVDANGYDVYLGGQPNPTQCLQGVIGELVAASPVRPDEMVAVETYLLTKHAAALSRDP